MQPALPFIFNRRNVNYVNGKKKQLGSLRSVFFLAFFGPIFGLLILYVLVGIDLITQIQVDQDYKTARAEITQGTSTTRQVIFTTYELNYAFEVDNVEYRRKQTVGGELWENTYVGDRVSIRYSTLDPSLSYIEGETVFSSGRLLMTALAIGFGILAIIAGIGAVREQLKLKKFSRNATIISGTLIKVDKSSLGKRTAVTYLTAFEFHTPEGKLIREIRSIPDKVVRPFRPLPEPGTPILILYESEQHFMVL